MCSSRPIDETASKPLSANVAVVAVAHLGQVAEALLGDGVLGPRGLLSRERHAGGPHTAASGVANHAAPAAADVEQSVARLQPQLLEHQPILVLLRLVEGCLETRVARARVGHRWPEHPLVERVRDVVVVVDRLGVSRLAVPQSLGDATPARRNLLRRRRDRPQVLDPDGTHDLGHHPRRRHLEHQFVGQRLEQLVGVAGVHAMDLEVAGDVGARQPEVAAASSEIGRSARRREFDAERRVGRPRRTSVVGGEPQR